MGKPGGNWTLWEKIVLDALIFSFIQQVLQNHHVLGAMFLPSRHTDQPEAWHMNGSTKWQWEFIMVCTLYCERAHNWRDQGRFLPTGMSLKMGFGRKETMGTAVLWDYISQCMTYSPEIHKELRCLEAEALSWAFLCRHLPNRVSDHPCYVTNVNV